MIRNRRSHWSCSKFANWIRGSKKPYSLTHEEWELWRLEQKSKRPLRFWLAEKFLNKLQNILFFPCDLWVSCNYYFLNRFVSKTHFLKTGLEPGAYHELDTRILYGLFNELKNFVEIELAHMQTLQDEKYEFIKGRSSEAGLAYLDWAATLKNDFLDESDPEYNQPSNQAKSAIEIRKLYDWWIDRDRRPDPLVVSGWNDCFEKGLEKERSKCYKKSQQIEKQYDDEDTKMLIRLIKIRFSLWT